MLKNDSDSNGAPLTAVLVTNVTKGTLTFNTDGSFTYKPTNNFTGGVSFTYQAKDAGGLLSRPVKVTIDVKNSWGRDDREDDDDDHNHGNHHHHNDNCDHDRGRNNHYDGDGCEHDRLRGGRDGDDD